MDELEIDLLNSQINRLKDSIEGTFSKDRNKLKIIIRPGREKAQSGKCDLMAIKTTISDHESRIQIVDDSVISNKTTTTLIQARPPVALTLIAAAIAAWLGSR